MKTPPPFLTNVARRGTRHLACAAMFAATLVCAQSVTIEPGAAWSLPAGTLSVDGGTLAVRGTLACADGAVTDVNQLSIAAGGAVNNSGACRYAVADGWNQQGAFVPGGSTVRFAPTAPNRQAVLTGETRFANLTVDTPGASLVLPAGATQRVLGTLTLSGASGAPVAVRSSQGGRVANLDLDYGGRESIRHVAVSDVYATGRWLAAFQTNEGGSGNARRWFGEGFDPVPVDHPLALALLGMLLAVAAALGMRRRARPSTRRAL
jgi:hypothetical protein